MSPFVTAYLKPKLHRLMLKQTRRFDGNPVGDASCICMQYAQMDKL